MSKGPTPGTKVCTFCRQLAAYEVGLVREGLCEKHYEKALYDRPDLKARRISTYVEREERVRDQQRRYQATGLRWKKIKLLRQEDVTLEGFLAVFRHGTQPRPAEQTAREMLAEFYGVHQYKVRDLGTEYLVGLNEMARRILLGVRD